MICNETLPLIEQAKTGDRQAFGDLVQHFEPAVYGMALAKLHDVNEALELTQEVFIHAMMKLRQLRDPACFVGWLRQITVRMAFNRLARKGRTQSALSDVLQSAADREGGPLDSIIRAENRANVWKGLRRLKEIDRATLVAFYIHGHSLKRMARDFETPVGTIKRRLHVARSRLRKLLERADTRRARRAMCRELVAIH